MKPVLLYPTLVLSAVACTSDDSPTQPSASEMPSAAVALAANSWSNRAAYPGRVTTRGFLAMAPNAAGQSIVYYWAATHKARMRPSMGSG